MLRRDVDRGVKRDLGNEKQAFHLGFFEAETRFSHERNCNSACFRDPLERNGVQRSHLSVTHHGTRRSYKGRPKDARLKGGPRWILQ